MHKIDPNESKTVFQTSFFSDSERYENTTIYRSFENFFFYIQYIFFDSLHQFCKKCEAH